MENASHASVWERVKPGLAPWPGADAVGKALEGGAKAEGVVLASEAAKTKGTARGLPPAQRPETVTRAAQNMEGAAHTAQRPETVTHTAQNREGAAGTAQSMASAAESMEIVPRAAQSMASAAETGFADADALPGAEPDPCCMGTEAGTDLAVLTGFIEDERAERRQLRALARQAPVWARQSLLTLASRAAARAGKLLAAYYLIAGETYLPAIGTERIYVGKWRPALRERYHGAACAAMNYGRAADGTPDPCLQDLFRELGADAFESAAAVMRLLERSLAG